METTYESNKRTARLAACLFFFVCVPTVSWGPGYILSKIFVPRNPAATVNNLLSNEFIFRTGIISHLASIIAFALMTLLLYKLFRPVDKQLSLMLIIPAMLEIVIVFVLELFHFSALMIMKGEALINVDTSQKQE